MSVTYAAVLDVSEADATHGYSERLIAGAG